MLLHPAVVAADARPGLTLVARADGRVHLRAWSPASVRVSGSPVAVATHPTEGAGFVATADGALHRVCAAGSHELVAPAGHRQHHALAASATALASLCKLGTLRLYDIESGARLAAFTGLHAGVLAPLPRGRWLATTPTGQAAIVDPSAGTLDPIGDPNARILALAAQDDTIFLASSQGIQRVSPEGVVRLPGRTTPRALCADGQALHLLTPRHIHTFCAATLTPRGRRPHDLLHPIALGLTAGGLTAFGDDGVRGGPRIPRHLSAWGSRRAWVAGNTLHTSEGPARHLPGPGERALCSATLTGAITRGGAGVVCGRGVVALDVRELHLGRQVAAWSRSSGVGWHDGHREHQRSGQAISVHPEDAWVAIAGDKIRLLTPAGAPVHPELALPFGTPLAALGVGPSTHRLLLADWAGRIALLQLGIRPTCWAICRLERPPSALGLLPDGDRAWIKLADGHIAILRLRDGSLVSALAAHTPFDPLTGEAIASVADADPLA